MLRIVMVVAMVAAIKEIAGMVIVTGRQITLIVIVMAFSIGRTVVRTTHAAIDRNDEERNDETSDSARQGRVA